MADIARRADIKVPSIYNHFRSKSDLLVAAVKQVFEERLSQLADQPVDPQDDIAFLMSPERSETRRVAVELHSAATRHPDVAALLHEWHRELSSGYSRSRPDLPVVRVPPPS